MSRLQHPRHPVGKHDGVMAIIAEGGNRRFVGNYLRATARTAVLVYLSREFSILTGGTLGALGGICCGKLLLVEFRYTEFADEFPLLRIEEQPGITVRTFITDC